MRLERARRVIVGLTIVSVVVSAQVAIAGWSWRPQTATAADTAATPTTEDAGAENPERVVLSLRVAARSRAIVDDPDLALLLAAAAYDLNPDDLEVRRSLLAATHSQPRLTRLLRGHAGAIRALAFSPDGSLLASSGQDGAIRVWDPRTGQPTGVSIATGRPTIWDLAFRGDGQQLAAAAMDAVQLWDPRTGAAGPTMTPSEGFVLALAYSPDGSMLATGTDAGVVELWDPLTGAAIPPALPSHDGGVAALAFTPDGSTLISVGFADETVMFSAVAGDPVDEEPLLTEQLELTTAALSPDGAMLATAGWDGAIRLWDPVSRLPIGDPLGNDEAAVQAMAFSPDGKILVAAAADGSIRAWDVVTRTQLGTPIVVAPGATLALASSPDGATLATGGEDGAIRLWEATSTESGLFASLDGNDAIPYAVAYSPDGTTIATGDIDGSIVLWDANAGSQLAPPLRGHTDGIRTLAFSPDGTILASAGWDETGRLWNVATGEARSVPLLGHESGILASAFSPDGEVLATGDLDGIVRRWRTSDWTPLGDPLQTGDPISAVSFDPQGAILAAADDSGAIHLWNAETGRPLLAEPIEAGEGPIWSLCFVRKGAELASAGDDGTIRYWNPADGSPTGSLPRAHTGAVRQLACDADGSRMVSSGADGRVVLWTVGEIRPQAELLEANDGGFQFVAMRPDGSQIAFTGDSDIGVALNVWDVGQGRLARVFPIWQVHLDAALSADGSRIVTGGENGQVAIWDAATGQLVAEQRVDDAGGAARVAISADGSTVAFGGVAGVVHLWRIAPGNAPRSLLARPDAGPVSALAFSPDGSLLAASDDDGTVRLWDTATAQPRGDFIHEDVIAALPVAVNWLAFAGDGSLLAAGGSRTITLWDVAREERVSPPLTGHANFIRMMAVQPGGRLLASADNVGAVRLWDLVSGQPLPERLVSAGGAVDALSFSPDGTLLAAGNAAGAVLLWDVSGPTVSALGQIDLSDRFVDEIAFTPDGSWLVSLDATGLVTRSNLSPEAWRQRACTVANRNLTREEWRTYVGNPDDETYPYHEICPGLATPQASRSAPAGGASDDAATPSAADPNPAAIVSISSSVIAVSSNQWRQSASTSSPEARANASRSWSGVISTQA